jgi:hypothetical protein
VDDRWLMAVPWLGREARPKDFSKEATVSIAEYASSQAPATLPDLLHEAGLPYIPEPGGGVAIPFPGAVVKARTLPTGVVCFGVPLPTPGRFARNALISALLRTSFVASYTKPVAYPDGSLAMMAELPLPVAASSPQTIQAIITALATLAHHAKHAPTNSRQWATVARILARAQGASIGIDPGTARAQLLHLARQAELEIIEAPGGPLLRLPGGLAHATANPSAISLGVYTPVKPPKDTARLHGLLALNLISDVARIAIDPDGDIALLYQIPSVQAGLFEHVDQQFATLAAGLHALDII